MYELDPKFEAVVCLLAAKSRTFYATIGQLIDPEMLDSAAAKHAIEAAHEFYRAHARPPAGVSVVLQQLRAKHLDGKLRSSEVRGVMELFDSAEDESADEASVISQLAPVIQRVQTRLVTAEMIKGAEGNRVQLAKRLADIETIGKVDKQLGYVFAPDDWSQVDALGLANDRLSFGIPELDKASGGGMKRGTAWLFAAPTNGGKSTMLCHIAANAWRMGMTVAYATLELAVGEIDLKIRANLSSVPLAKMTEPRWRTTCEQRLRALWPNRGGLAIKKFRSRLTTWPQILDWWGELAENKPGALGHEPDVLLVDFLGKLAPTDKKQDKYEAQGVIMDAMHDWADEGGKWVCTASQLQRGKGDKKIADTDDLNESQGKVEGADGLVTLNLREDGNELYYFLAKNRGGQSKVGVGPLPHDFAFGRMCKPHRFDEAPTDYSPDLGWEAMP